MVVYRVFGGWKHDWLGCGRWRGRARPRVQPRLKGMDLFMVHLQQPKKDILESSTGLSKKLPSTSSEA